MQRKTTEDFIGTCQACFGEFKVNERSHQIVYHGYKRPGIGYTFGGCEGTDHAPFEYDTELTVRIIQAHRNRVNQATVRKGELEAGKITKLTRHWQDFDRVTFKTIEKSEEVEPGHKEWQRTLDLNIYRCESDITYHTRVGDYLQKMVDTWTRGKIVGIDVPATGLPRQLRKAYDPAEADAAEARAKEKATRDAKPGKLKVVFYQPAFARDFEPGDDAGWRKWIDTMRAQEAQFVTDVKAKIKATFEGKTRVVQGYSSDLPRQVRQGDYDVAIVNLPWEYLDQIDTLLPAAETWETEAKRRSFTHVGLPTCEKAH